MEFIKKNENFGADRPLQGDCTAIYCMILEPAREAVEVPLN